MTRPAATIPSELPAIRDADAARLAGKGYFPKTETYVPGSWGAGVWLVAILLILFFLVGLLVIVYLLAAKPPGDLTVIYELQPDANAAATAPAPTGSQGAVEDRLRALDELQARGLITTEEFQAKRAEILATL